jgi:hypothetical protein
MTIYSHAHRSAGQQRFTNTPAQLTTNHRDSASAARKLSVLHPCSNFPEAGIRMGQCWNERQQVEGNAARSRN